MKTSAAGIALIKQYEGCRLHAYLCPDKVWTIGYGHTSAAGPPTVTPSLVITQAQAEEILIRDLAKFEERVTSLVKVPLTQGQFDALMGFTYNCGAAALERSTLLKRVNAGALDKAPAEFMKWTKASGRDLPGLIARRRAEVKLWRGLPDRLDPDETRAIPQPPEPAKGMAKSREGNAAIAAGAAGTVAAVTEALPAIQQGVGLLPTLTDAFGRPVVVAGVIVAVLAAAIWYWRRQRLLEGAE